MEDRPWATWGRQEKPLTPHVLAKLLRPFGIVPGGDMRFSEGVRKGYRRAAFEDAWTRYVDIEALQGNKPNKNGPQTPFSKGNGADAVAVAKSEVQPINTAVCCDVAVDEGPSDHLEF